MAASPKLSFGDFTKQEYNDYFQEVTCVELPPVSQDDWVLQESGDRFPKQRLCFFSGPKLEEGKQNHIIDEFHLSKVPLHNEEIHLVTQLSPLKSIKCNGKEQNMREVKGSSPDNGNVSYKESDLSAVQGQQITTNHKVKDKIFGNVQSSIVVGSMNNSNPANLKTWASLFNGVMKDHVNEHTKSIFPTHQQNGSKQSLAPKELLQNFTRSGGGMVNITGFTTPAISKIVDVKDDAFSKQIADQLSRNEIVYKSRGLMPRGLVNSCNWCYVNATLQALLTSSPFCHLMRSLPSRQPSFNTNVQLTSTPVLDSFVRLVKDLRPLKKGSHKIGKDQFHSTSYEPHYIYKMLVTTKSKFSEKGRQEDAEEFLSCVLNGLHEEIQKVCDFHFPNNGYAQTSQISSQCCEVTDSEVHDEQSERLEDSHQWEEVIATKKNKTSALRKAGISKTPVSEVFQGELRSDLFQEGVRTTATLEPFFTLPLDINDQRSKWSVNEALEHLTRLETVQDFTNAKTKTKGEVSRRITLQTLPPVLILHLKRFVYDKKGGSLKIDKEVQYHTDLVIGKELLSKSSKKLSQDKRTYKLFAVVYHHGQFATGGHYTTDVYHDGLNCWLRIDDQTIKMSNVREVVRHHPQRTAYLLYYKRTDLMAV